MIWQLWSGSIPAITPAQPTATVGERGRILGNPSHGAVDRVQMHGGVGVGMASAYRLCSAIASSVISVKKSAFQYNCTPFGG